MSTPREPLQANLTISLMYNDQRLLETVKERLMESYGMIDMASPAYDFSAISPYYDPEMGLGIKKIIYSFERTIPRELLRSIKLDCNAIEDQYMVDGKRQINLDPGMVTMENFQLATNKNFSHRVYLGEKVFCEVTLLFNRDSSIKELPWTYRDYLYEPARSFIMSVRENYRKKIGLK